MAGIFISYRRDDSPGHAGRIFDRLRSRFGSDAVFMDVAAIEAGVDFVEALHAAVGSCDALVAVIGPQWFSAAPDGRRRLDDPHDFVRLEIAGALERNIRVLPVLVEGASLPPTADLPDDLRALTRRQAVELRDSRWDDDIERLVHALEKLVAGKVGQAPSAAAGQSRAAPAPGRLFTRAALAALVLAVAVVLGWLGGVLPGTRSARVTGRPGQTPGDRALPPPAAAAAAGVSDGAAGAVIPDGIPGQAGVPPARPAPASSRPDAPAAGGVTVARMPDVRGMTILEARETLRTAGFRFLIRVFENRSREPGIVETQTLDDTPVAGQAPRVILTAVATSTVLVHVGKGDEREAEPLVAYLRAQASAMGSLVRSVAVVPRPEMAGRVGYSEDRLAAQAEAIAADVSGFLARSGSDRRVTATRRPAVTGRTIIVAVYEREP